MSSSQHYHLAVLYWPKEKLNMRLGLDVLDPPEPAPTGQRIDMVVGYSPELASMQQHTRFELKTQVAGVQVALDVFLLSYEPDTSGLELGAMSWRPFLSTPEQRFSSLLDRLIRTQPQKSPVV